MASLESAYDALSSYASIAEAYGGINKIISGPVEKVDPEIINVVKVTERYKYIKQELKGKRTEVASLDTIIDSLTEKNKSLCESHLDITKNLIHEELAPEFTKLYNEYDTLKNKLIAEAIEKKNNKIMDLMNEIHDFEAELSAIRSVATQIDNGLEESDKNKNCCPICFEREVNICINPCGHTICSECNKVSGQNMGRQFGKCPTCRGTVTSFIKIFFSV